MSLKVLLADESSTIKKVFQLALQDYAVEVVAVQSGDGVLPVAEKNDPDIIFVDILMQKRSGYDVSGDLKSSPQFSNVPVVLMWSSFLTLDKDKFQASGADAQIEKPFDVQTLRALINKLVPKTGDQVLSNFLQMPDVTVNKEVKQTPTLTIAPELPENSIPETTDQFEEVNLDIKLKTDSAKEIRNLDQTFITDEEEDTEPGWVQKTLSETSSTGLKLSPDLDIPDDEIPFDEIKTRIDTVVNQRLNESNQEFTNISPPALELDNEATIEHPLENVSTSVNTFPGDSYTPNEDEIREIIRTEAKSIIEQAVWKIVPDLATQLIEKEIQRLMSKKDNDIGTY